MTSKTPSIATAARNALLGSKGRPAYRQPTRGKNAFTPNAFRVACIIAGSVESDGYLSITREELALQADVSPRTLQVALQALEHYGIITVQRFKTVSHASNIRLQHPDAWTPVDPEYIAERAATIEKERRRSRESLDRAKRGPATVTTESGLTALPYVEPAPVEPATVEPATVEVAPEPEPATVEVAEVAKVGPEPATATVPEIATVPERGYLEPYYPEAEPMTPKPEPEPLGRMGALAAQHKAVKAGELVPAAAGWSRGRAA